MMRKLKTKGQGSTGGIIVLAVGILIGVFLIGSIYLSVDQDSLPASVTTSMETVLSNSNTGFTLLAVGVIVAAAYFILSMMRA